MAQEMNKTSEGVMATEPQEPKSSINSTGLLFRDATLMIAAFTGILYVIGFIYWKTYWSYFGIDLYSVGLSIVHILSAAWSTALFFCYILVTSIIHNLRSARPITEYTLRTETFLISYFAMSISQLNSSLAWWQIICAIAASMLFLLLVANKRARSPNADFFAWLFPNNLLSTFSFVALLCFTFYAFCTMGARVDARNAISGETESKRYSLEDNNGKVIATNLILICHADSKYFVCFPTVKNSKPVVFVYPDSIVSKATIRSYSHATPKGY